MARITITTDMGTVVESIDLNDYDLTRQVARAAVTVEVLHAAQRAVEQDASEPEG